jgi:PAS domain-containing protein
MKNFKEMLLLVLASCFSLLLVVLKTDGTLLHGIVIAFIILSVILFNLTQRPLSPAVRKLINSFILVGSTFSIELLVVSTGGFFSHFLLLAFLFCLAIGFFISLRVSLSFLVLFYLILGVQVVFDPTLLHLFYSDITTLVLFVLAFIVAGNLAYFLNRSYTIKDLFVEVLHKQLKVVQNEEQSILSSVEELIIITDKDLHIISVNEAVEKILLLSRSELFQKHLFEVLFLKNSSAIILNKEIITLSKIIEEKQELHFDNLLLVTKTGSSEEHYQLHIKPILNLEGNVDQILFTLLNNDLHLHDKTEEDYVLDLIITKHQAMIEDLKRTLLSQQLLDLAFKAEVIGKIDREILYLIALQNPSFQNTITPINMARLGKNVYEVFHPFAEAMHVNLHYKLLNIGTEDVKDIQLADAQISVDEMTRTLYTAKTNLRWIEILLHKLMDMAIVLSSSSENQSTTLSLQKSDNGLLIKIQSGFTKIDQKDLHYLYTLNFGPLANRTNLMIASGLEGYIAKLIAEKITLPITIEISDQGLCFSLLLP